MTIEDRLLAEVERRHRLIETCHERRACPKCGEPVGSRCKSLGRVRKETKHPHKERFEMEVPLR
jgi:hypothetical protein